MPPRPMIKSGGRARRQIGGMTPQMGNNPTGAGPSLTPQQIQQLQAQQRGMSGSMPPPAVKSGGRAHRAFGGETRDEVDYDAGSGSGAGREEKAEHNRRGERR